MADHREGQAKQPDHSGAIVGHSKAPEPYCRGSLRGPERGQERRALIRAGEGGKLAPRLRQFAQPEGGLLAILSRRAKDKCRLQGYVTPKPISSVSKFFLEVIRFSNEDARKSKVTILYQIAGALYTHPRPHTYQPLRY